MKQKIYIAVIIFISITKLQAQVVSGIQAVYHNGQIFITWNNIPNADSGFYYIYQNTVPINSHNFSTSTYIGRVPYNFSYDMRFTAASFNNQPRYLVINDTPFTKLQPNQNVFVITCTQDLQRTYYAVRCDYGKSAPNYKCIPGYNSIEEGRPVKQHIAPVKAYLQEANTDFAGANNGEKMDVYIHYGGNTATAIYPAMANEGCLAFHFGIIKSAAPNGNRLFLKFHGGNGNFISNAINAVMDSAWKITFDDWIPNYYFSSTGSNTRWYGYNEHFNIYNSKVDDPSPTTGINKAFTFYRVNWELDWIMEKWKGTFDTSSIYLIGSSQGCGAVWLHSTLNPEKFAAANATDGRLSLDSPDDDNPDCKYNDGGTARNEVRDFFGNEKEVNLQTDILKPGSSNEYYNFYDLTNVAYMLEQLKYVPKPFMNILNGKEDDNTCWEEKIPVYNAVNNFNAGGRYYWDLRGHGGGDQTWQTLSIPNLKRFKTNRSYPAFSQCTCNGNPGDTYNPAEPYYDGDDIGALNGFIDWYDSSMVDSSNVWQINAYIYQQSQLGGLYYPAALPDSITTNITIIRPQLFKGFQEGTDLCWTATHDSVIQSGTLKVEL
jgi:hypothetical protein